jgi:hypothetical protein
MMMKDGGDAIHVVRAGNAMRFLFFAHLFIAAAARGIARGVYVDFRRNALRT